MKVLFDSINHWDKLGWYDRKHIWFICARSRYKFDPKHAVIITTILSVIGIFIGEHHRHHKIGLLSIVVLFYFYTILIDCFYRWFYQSGGGGERLS